MKVKTDFFYKSILFLLLFLPIAIASPELNILVSTFFSVLIVLDLKTKFSKLLLSTVFPLILILTIASISSFFYSNERYDIIKDFFYLLKPILYVFLGYYLVKKIRDKNFVFIAVIYLATLFAIIHIYEVIWFLIDNSFNVNNIRGESGKANYLEMLAVVLLFVNKKQIFFSIPLKYKRLIKIILYCSFILYFSRTMFLAVFILVLSVKGYAKLTRKGLMYISIFLGFIALFYVFLNTIEIDRESTGIDGFLYKLKIAPSEIFSSDINIEDHASLWDHWRGYEALKAFEQLGETKYYLGVFFGKGLGALVDLGFVAPLNSDGIQFIPTIHNGYAYIFFKSGFFGFICYMLFLGYLYLQSYFKKENEMGAFINNTISGLAIYFAFTTLVISGIYNHGDVIAIILGGLLYLKSYYNENRINSI